MTNAVGAPTPSLPHLVTSPPSPPAKSPLRPSGTPTPDQHVKRSFTSPSPKLQQPASPSLLTHTLPPVMQAAGTNSGGPDALRLRSRVTFSDEDLTDPPSDEKSTRDQATAIHPHRAVKRPRADTPPAAKAPSKRSRREKFAAKPKAVTMNVGTRSARPAQSSTKNKEHRSGDGMDISDPPESEDTDGSDDEDEVMGGNGDQFRGSEKAATPPRGRSVGKGKAAVIKTASLRTPSAILSLGKDIPVKYEPLSNPLQEDELFELDWFAPVDPTAPQGNLSKKGKTKSMAPVSGVSPPVSQTPPTRRWHSFTAPCMTLNPKAPGEVELSDGAFCFSFNAQVIKRFIS